jgi:hypothetical protein
MISIVNKNLILILFLVNTLVFFGFRCAKISFAKIENNVSATANTGGNKIEGSGTITTGKASASVEAVNIVNGAGENSVQAEARAEANREAVEINYEGNGPVELSEESADGSAETRIEVRNEIETQTSSENGEKKSFLGKVWDFITSLI